MHQLRLQYEPQHFSNKTLTHILSYYSLDGLASNRHFRSRFGIQSRFAFTSVLCLFCTEWYFFSLYLCTPANFHIHYSHKKKEASTTELKCISFINEMKNYASFHSHISFLFSRLYSVRHWHSHDHANNVRLLYLLYVHRRHKSSRLHRFIPVFNDVWSNVFSNH